MKNTQVKKKCLTCCSNFYVIRCRERTAKFCSKTCIRSSAEKKLNLSLKIKTIPRSESWRKNISLAKLSEKNPMWKGDKAGLDAIHIWVLRNKPKPKLCVECKKKVPKDLANISQKYFRDVKDFEWLCRGCHMRKDGRINNLK